MKRKLLTAAALTLVLAGLAVLAAALTGSRRAPVVSAGPHPTVSDFQFISAATPTDADCEAVGAPALRRRRSSRRTTSARSTPVPATTARHHDRHRRLVGQRHDGSRPPRLQQRVRPAPHVRRGRRDVHLRDADVQGLVPERRSRDEGSPGKEPGTRGQERLGARGRARRRDGTRDGARSDILLVAPTGSETLGVQGFPNMMKAEKYVVDNDMAQVISQSFASAEDAFGSSESLENLRDAFKRPPQRRHRLRLVR